MVQIDPWPAGTFGVVHEQGRRIFRCLPICARRPRTTGTPVPSKVSWLRRRRGRCGPRGGRPRGRALCAVVGQLLPEDNGPLRTDLKRSRSPSPRDRVFRSRQFGALAEVVAPGRDGPLEASCCTRLAMRTPGRSAPSSTGVGVRDGRALWTPRGDARVEERLRCRRVGTRPHGQFLTLDATASARSSTSTTSTPTSGASHGPGPTPSACTKRTTGSCGNTSICPRAGPRCAARVASWSAPSPPLATTSTGSIGTSTSTAPSNSR